jgi:hypothetical protein
MGNLLYRLIPEPLGGVFVFLSGAVERLAINVLGVSGQIVLHAVVRQIGTVRQGWLAPSCFTLIARETNGVQSSQVGPVPFCVGPVPETQNFARPGDVTSWGHQNHYRRIALRNGERRKMLRRFNDQSRGS